ncbi:broad-spectrum mercury transporter MerE [Paraburkholderia strydomiana]|uniref:broad-spectrum mercury transporter MerE n=1 Tax=Paraburkholderia strydomiana TaxID=1245417 RepID=UPI0038B76C83
MRDRTAPGLSRGARWRAWLWGALAALTCPCHLPIVLLALSGTAAGALVSQHKGIAVVVLLVLFALSLTRALRAFRAPR